MGTGTSLMGFDFSRLAGRLTIGLNDALLVPGLDLAYHIFHDTGLWPRYVGFQPHSRTTFICSKHGRTSLLRVATCSYRARIYFFDHAGAARDVEVSDDQLYVDRTIATAGIQLAWKLGARRIFLLGVDGYKLRRPDGGESYYWTGEPKTYQRRPDGDRVVERGRKERAAMNGLVMQDRHEKWIENMRELRRAFDVRKVFACKWPGEGVYNLSARSTIDAWPKVPVEEVIP